MLAVTTRPEIRDQLSRNISRVNLPAPFFLSCAEQLVKTRESVPLLFLDLASCCSDHSLETAIRCWRARSGGEIIFFVPLVDRERETRLLFRLAALGVGRVMTQSDFARPEVWRNIKETFLLESLRKEICQEFLAATSATGRHMTAEPIVLQILREAPTIVSLSVTAGAVLPDPRLTPDANRKAVWSTLRRAGQMPASRLLLMFRLLWHIKLAERGWPSGQIALFMGFRNTRDFRRTIRRRFGVSMADLKQIAYADALAWAGAMCTGDHERFARCSVSAMVGPLKGALVG